MYRWRIAEKIKAVISERSKEIIILCTKINENKDTIKRIAYNFSDPKEIDLKNYYEFKAKLNEHLGVSLFINDSWYDIKNLDNSTVGKIIERDNNIVNGVLSEKVNIAISEYSTDIRIVTSTLDEYIDYINEMGRVSAIEFNRKSKKLIAGNRYDSIDNTYYFLGEYESTVSGSNFSAKFDVCGSNKLYLFSNNIKDCSSISDVFKNKDIIILDSVPDDLLDTGNVLKKDVPSNGDLVSLLINKNISLRDFIYILTIKSDFFNIDTIKNKFDEYLFNYILRNYDTISYRYNERIGSKCNNNEKRIINGIFTWGSCVPYIPSNFYIDLFSRYGINLSEHISEYLKTNIEDRVFSSLDNIINFGETYLDYRGILESNKELGKTELSAIIEEIKKNNPDISKITIKDVVNYKKGKENISESLNNEILNCKFVRINR